MQFEKLELFLKLDCDGTLKNWIAAGGVKLNQMCDPEQYH